MDGYARLTALELKTTARLVGTLYATMHRFELFKALTGIDAEYYGAGTDPTVAANVQGTGTLSIGGGGNIRVGSGISVTGDNPVCSINLSSAIGGSESRNVFGFPFVS